MLTFLALTNAFFFQILFVHFSLMDTRINVPNQFHLQKATRVYEGSFLIYKFYSHSELNYGNVVDGDKNNIPFYAFPVFNPS